MILGMNLQICFMNETMSDTESPNSDSELPIKAVSPMKQPSPLAATTDVKPVPVNGNVRVSNPKHLENCLPQNCSLPNNTGNPV